MIASTYYLYESGLQKRGHVAMYDFFCNVGNRCVQTWCGEEGTLYLYLPAVI